MLAKEWDMLLKWALVFLIVAVFGFGGIAAGAAEIAKILFFIFIVVFVIALVVGLLQGRRTGM